MMYTVLEPSTLWISENDWNDEETRDVFLDHILNNLITIGDYGITRIYWTDELEELLWSAPNLPPWRINKDWKNQIIPVINRHFIKNIEVVNTNQLGECMVEPPLKYNFEKQGVQAGFLSLMHYVINKNEQIFLCLGITNNSPEENSYTFCCDCCGHDNIKPIHIYEHRQWHKFVNIETDYWPSDVDEVGKLVDALRITARIQFATDNFRYSFSFEKNFMREILDLKSNIKLQMLYAMSKRLLSNQQQASSSSSLNDEPVRGKDGERRFRINRGNRIHYKYLEDGTLCFLRYFGDGEHDRGL